MSQSKLSFIAQDIINSCAEELPDLSQQIILTTHLHIANPLSKIILTDAQKLGYPALLAPRIYTIKTYLETLPIKSPSTLSLTEQQLMLFQELRNHPTLYGKSSPWVLAENLLKLFTDLTLQHTKLPKKESAFVEILAAAYKITTDHPNLIKEARLVHTLWVAWQQQLEAHNTYDHASLYLFQLQNSIQHIAENTHFYAVGFATFLPAEAEWLTTLAKQKKLKRIISNNILKVSDLLQNHTLSIPTESNAYNNFIDYCYQYSEKSIQQRVHAIQKAYPDNPAINRINIQGFNSLDQEVNAIQNYIIDILAKQQKAKIGIITTDRKLARRLRATTERYGIHINDSVGWALSTSNTATIIENWLDCVANDFPYLAMLDLLKSPAITNIADTDKLSIIHRFENDIIFYDNINSGLERYRSAIENRKQKFSNWDSDALDSITALLDHLVEAATEIQMLLDREQKATVWTNALFQSLQKLGIDIFLQDDIAGSAILDVINHMLYASKTIDTNLSWSEFHNWLSIELEKNYFTPDSNPSNIRFIQLSDSSLDNLDAIIIAGANESALPIRNSQSPFFNNSVRSALQLTTIQESTQQQFEQFKDLLISSNSILISWQAEKNGEPMKASPWVEAIINFHNAAYKTPLDYVQLTTTAEDVTKKIIDTTSETQAPSPTIPSTLVPNKISVAGHQRLINCPYQFYIYDILKLKPLDEMRSVLKKSDYGSLVHKCLEAFHSDVPHLPGPFTERLSTDNYQQGLAIMEKITHAVFKQDIKDNFLHNGWLTRWINFAPQYLNWQIKHNNEWNIVATEKRHEAALNDSISLYGRLDRIDQHHSNTKIIDYKTGTIPKMQDVDSGEDVQLVSYALLIDHVSQVQYLGIDGSAKVNDNTIVADELLIDLRDSIKERLITLIQKIRSGAPLSAIPHETTCSYCDAANICRQKAWST